MRQLSVIPPMMYDSEQRRVKFINMNGLMDDPMKVYKARQFMNVWTEHEKEIFKEKWVALLTSENIWVTVCLWCREFMGLSWHIWSKQFYGDWGFQGLGIPFKDKLKFMGDYFALSLPIETLNWQSFFFFLTFTFWNILILFARSSLYTYVIRSNYCTITLFHHAAASQVVHFMLGDVLPWSRN